VTKMDAGMDPKQYLEKLLIKQKSATGQA